MRARQRLKSLAMRMAARWLPPALVYEAAHAWAKRRPRIRLATASDLMTIDAGPGMRIAVYRSDVPGAGRGPSASVYVLDEEVLRLDCFGGEHGHMHFNPEQAKLRAGYRTPRVYFPEGSVAEHIVRAEFEVRRNLANALADNQLRRVNAYSPDPAALEAALRAMRRRLEQLAAG